MWLTLFIRQLNILISNMPATSSTEIVNIKIRYTKDDIEENKKVEVDKDNFAILQLRRSIAFFKSLAFGNVSIYLEENENLYLDDNNTIPKDNLVAVINEDSSFRLEGDIEQIDVSEENKEEVYLFLTLLKEYYLKEWKDIIRSK